LIVFQLFFVIHFVFVSLTSSIHLLPHFARSLVSEGVAFCRVFSTPVDGPLSIEYELVVPGKPKWTEKCHEWYKMSIRSQSPHNAYALLTFEMFEIHKI
jgi:hypothetical protein